MQVSKKMYSAKVTSEAFQKDLITYHQMSVYDSLTHSFSSGRRLSERQQKFMDSGEYTTVQGILDKLTGEDINIQWAALEKKAREISGEAFPVMTSPYIWQEKGTCDVFLANGTAVSLLD